MGLGGIAMAWIGQEEAAAGMIEEGSSIARQLGADVYLGEALAAKSLHLYAYMHFPESLATGCEAADLLRSSGDLWNLANVLGFGMFSATFTLRFEQALAIGEELEPLAARIGHAGAAMFVNRCRGLIEQTRRPDLDAFEQFARSDLEWCERNELPWSAQSHVFLGRRVSAR